MRTEELVVERGRGARIATWHAADGAFHPGPQQQHRDRVLIVWERDRVEFGLDHARDGCEYRLWIGSAKEPAFTTDDSGWSQGSCRWGSACHFDSACGPTRLVLESRLEGPDAAWSPLIEAEVFVNPTKAGKAALERMSEDIAELSRGLVYDVFGKSERLHEIRALRTLSGRLRRPEDEIFALERIVSQADFLLKRLTEHPASRILVRQRLRKLRESDILSPRELRSIESRHHDIRRGTSSLTVFAESKIESFDIPEHQLLVGMLEQIAARSQRCLRFVQLAIKEIESYRRYRDFIPRYRNDGRTLFQAEDQPTIAYFRESIRRARGVCSTAKTLRRIPLLQGIPARTGAISAAMFNQNPEYRAARRLVESVRKTDVAPSRGTALSRSAKDSWRLFEQWTFLQIVESFRWAGLKLSDWDESLRLHLRSDFVIDFKRGLSFYGSLSRDWRVRLRYEPFVLARPDAVAEGETIYNGGTRAVTPDITIELQRRATQGWTTVYATVLDAKYSLTLKPDQWQQVHKYGKIRCVGDGSQVRHIGIVFLSRSNEIAIEDDAEVSFSAEHGLNCEPTHRVDFHIGSMPAMNDAKCADVFRRFATGTLGFMTRCFL